MQGGKVVFDNPESMDGPFTELISWLSCKPCDDQHSPTTSATFNVLATAFQRRCSWIPLSLWASQSVALSVQSAQPISSV